MITIIKAYRKDIFALGEVVKIENNWYECTEISTKFDENEKEITSYNFRC